MADGNGWYDSMNAKKDLFIIGASNVGVLTTVDQLICIPPSDEFDRLSILEASLRKSPVSKDVSLNLVAKNALDYSCADLTEFCLRGETSESSP